MRFKSKKSEGFQVFAVSGVNTISFAITATAQARKGLQGFAVERIDNDPKKPFRKFVRGFKVFPSVIPKPDPTIAVSTKDHPVQSFVWDDFTAKDQHRYEYLFHPVRGTPSSLDRSAAPVSIKVKTEPLFSKLTHDVFFNRGVASSQAYSREFGNVTPSKLPPDKRQKALDWLSRDLDEAILLFIREAKQGDTLLCCFYEFRYKPVAQELKAAIDRGVNVKIIVDGKENGTASTASFPREDNLKMIKSVKIPKKNITLREAKPNDIQHNKFMVHLKGAHQRPIQVWTGSTNISDGGVHGQTNVGHWVRDELVAKDFQSYWEVLKGDPGAKAGDDRTAARKANDAFRQDVEGLINVPTQLKDIPAGVTSVFSPRRGTGPLDLYIGLVDSADDCSCITLAFGVNKGFKAQLVDNTSQSPLVFMLLEKEDKPKPPKKNAKKPAEPFVALTAKNNIYKAWGSFLSDPVYQFARETNAKKLQLNQHVSYIHSKFLLFDPLGDDPIVVTGSANFSEASINANDENMLIIRGDTRVADIYFTEFNRLFNHYYFRAVNESTARAGVKPDHATVFLSEKGEWLEKYKPGTLRTKRVNLLAKMKGFVQG